MIINDTPTPGEPAAAPAPAETLKAGERRPIVAPWLRNRGEFLAVVGDTVYRACHAAAWHVVHSPFHAARFVMYTPRGIYRTVRALWRWVLLAEIKPLREAVIDANLPAEWQKLEKERKERVAVRWRAVTVSAGLLVLATLLWWWLAPRWAIAFGWELTPGWTVVLATVAGVLSFGYLGRPADKPLVKSATDVSGNPPLRSETVVNALVSLRIPGMTKPEDIRLLHDIATPSSGYLFELELPPGVTAETVMEKRSELSAALRHPLGTVWPAVGKRHQGHLVLFVSHEDMNTVRQKPWPLMSAGAVDVFRPQPLFTDQRNRWVDLTLAYTSGVVGSIPRMGKTFILRELLLVAALDPRCKVHAFDFKGTGDLAPLRVVAHRYACTARPEKIAELLPVFEELQQELFRRSEVIEGLAYEVCPENKVTPELASRRELGLEPIVIGVDECHELFEHEDQALRARFIRIFTDLIKRGPALGFITYLATQKPSAKSIPTAIAHNAIIRICLKVLGWQSNDQVLGDGMSKAGLKAQMFAWEDKGIAYLKGEGADAAIVRSVSGLNAPASEKVAARARAAREAQGRLTGDAAGVALEQPELALLDDVGQVLGGAEAMHLTDLAAGLAALRPALYGSLDARSLGSQLRAAGVQTTNVYVTGKPREHSSAAGVKREWLDAARKEDGDGTVAADPND